MMTAIAVVTGTLATAASAQTPTPASPSGPAYSKRFFTTALEKDPSRVVQMQMQLHLPNRPGNGFHTHNGDQWEAVIEGEITYTVKGQPPRVLKVGDSAYIPAGYGHGMLNTGDEDLEIVQTWDAGKFEEITLKHWMATAPNYLLSNNMAGVPASTLDKLQSS